jgi:hypothetical protein
MAIFYTDTGSISDLVVSNKLEATGSLYGTASWGISAVSADQGDFVVAAGGSTNTVSQLVFSNANNVSFGLNGSTITATATGGGGGGGFTYPYFNPYDGYVQVTGVLGSNSLYFQPFQCPNVQFDRLAIPIYISQATNSTFAATISFYWGLYTRTGSTLSLLTDASLAFGSDRAFSSTNSSLFHGIRLWTAGITDTLTEGQYYAALMSRITTAGNAQSISNIVISQQNSSFSGLFGEASNATVQYTRGLGRYSATTSNLPASVALSQIQGNSSAFLRAPIFYLVSQTF